MKKLLTILALSLLGSCGGPTMNPIPAAANPGLKKSTVMWGSTALTVYESGKAEGPTLVFAHGSPGDASGWS